MKRSTSEGCSQADLLVRQFGDFVTLAAGHPGQDDMTQTTAKRISALSAALKPGDEPAQEAAFDVAFQHLVGEVFRLNGCLLAVAEGLSRDLGITPSQWQLLGILRHRSMTVSEAARRLGLTRQSVQRTTNQLIEAGMIEAAENPADRRSILLKITQRGRRTAARLVERQVQLTDIFMGKSRLRTKSVRKLGDALMRLRKNAEATMP